MDLCCINCIKKVLFLKIDCHSCGDSGYWEIYIVREDNERPWPCLSKLNFLCMIFFKKKYSIYFTLWLLDFKKENIQLCIKTRYQGFFCSGRCVYRILVYSRNSSFMHLCLGYVNDVEWNLLRLWRQMGCTRFYSSVGNFIFLSGHLLSPIFKVTVKWPSEGHSSWALQAGPYAQKSLYRFKFSRSISAQKHLWWCVVLFCVLYVTQAYSICTKKSLLGACCYGGKNILKLIFPRGLFLFYVLVVVFC